MNVLRHKLQGLQTILVLCLLFSSGVSANNLNTVKTAFIFNFFKHITFDAPVQKDHIHVCFLGRGENFLSAIHNKSVIGKKVIVTDDCEKNSFKNVDVIYVDDSHKSAVTNIVKQKKLTISGIEGFASKGGIIEFLLVSNKLRFKINNESARAHGVTISSSLLKLAIEVYK